MSRTMTHFMKEPPHYTVRAWQYNKRAAIPEWLRNSIFGTIVQEKHLNGDTFVQNKPESYPQYTARVTEGDWIVEDEENCKLTVYTNKNFHEKFASLEDPVIPERIQKDAFVKLDGSNQIVRAWQISLDPLYIPSALLGSDKGYITTLCDDKKGLFLHTPNDWDKEKPVYTAFPLNDGDWIVDDSELKYFMPVSDEIFSVSYMPVTLDMNPIKIEHNADKMFMDWWIAWLKKEAETGKNEDISEFIKKLACSLHDDIPFGYEASMHIAKIFFDLATDYTIVKNDKLARPAECDDERIKPVLKEIDEVLMAMDDANGINGLHLECIRSSRGGNIYNVWITQV